MDSIYPVRNRKSSSTNEHTAKQIRTICEERLGTSPSRQWAHSELQNAGSVQNQMMLLLGSVLLIVGWPRVRSFRTEESLRALLRFRSANMLVVLQKR